MLDCLIVGGGAIGLSLAYELAGRSAKVRVIDAGRPGGESSWAGAGILPPASEQLSAAGPLTALSNRLHARWHEQLLAETGIDNGYRASGGIYLARDPATARTLDATAAELRQAGIECLPLADRAALTTVEPGLSPGGEVLAAFYLPGECQIRNPRHVKALIAGCRARGVEITPELPAEDFIVRSGASKRSSRTAARWRPIGFASPAARGRARLFVG